MQDRTKRNVKLALACSWLGVRIERAGGLVCVFLADLCKRRFVEMPDEERPAACLLVVAPEEARFAAVV